MATKLYVAWRSVSSPSGKGPTARQIADATGASIHTARAALRRFRAGNVPREKTPGLEPKTVRNVHIMVHSALTTAVRWSYVLDNAASHVRPPRVPRRKPTVWSPAQLRQFLQFISADRFYALFLLAATTGLRRAELCGLRWPAVDLRSGTLSVEPDTRVVVNGIAQDSDGNPIMRRACSLSIRSPSQRWPNGDHVSRPNAPSRPRLRGYRSGVHLGGWPRRSPGRDPPAV